MGRASDRSWWTLSPEEDWWPSIWLSSVTGSWVVSLGHLVLAQARSGSSALLLPFSRTESMCLRKLSRVATTPLSLATSARVTYFVWRLDRRLSFAVAT